MLWSVKGGEEIKTSPPHRTVLTAPLSASGEGRWAAASQCMLGMAWDRLVPVNSKLLYHLKRFLLFLSRLFSGMLEYLLRNVEAGGGGGFASTRER